MDEFEKWAVSRGYSLMDKRPDGSPHPRYPAIQTEAAWQAWQAAVKVGREVGMREAGALLKARAERAESALADAERKGREQGMREAAGLCQSFQPKDFTAAGIMTRAQCADAILAAIEGG